MATSISASLFAESFRRAWIGTRNVANSQRTSQNGTGHLPRKLGKTRNLGLAISGGADSMALAYLCRQLELSSEHSATGGPFSVTGFVVDHRAREESSHEASTVAGWLSDLGIKTQILELDWSPFRDRERPSLGDAGSSMPTAFETYARRLRFQALGKACRDCGIEALLMGHHRDDSVETTIWRMATGARRAGLGGIQEVARIPECHGIFGVSESGSSLQLAANQSNHSIQRPLVRLNDRSEGRVSFLSGSDKLLSKSTPSSIATGGIFLCRPLLAFPKTMLLETCHQNNIPYVSDPTNFDPTPASILALNQSSKDFLQLSNQLSDQLLAQQCRILDLNLKTGTMVVRFVQVPASSDPLLANNTAERIRQIQSLTLRRITELVSPFPGNHFSLRSFEPFVSRIFHSTLDNGSGRDTQPKPFTLGGVMFHPLRMESSVSFQTSPSEKECVWMFSRQPFMKNRSPVLRCDIPLPESEQSPHTPSFGSWLLWDDRFWFRFSLVRTNRGKKERHSAPAHRSKTFPLVLRPFQKSDLEVVRRGSTQRGTPGGPLLLKRLKNALVAEAPGSTRFTVPLLDHGVSIKSGSAQSDEDLELLVLPTLDFSLFGPSKGSNEIEISYEGRGWTLGWEWMYKMIDIEALRLMGRPV
ncbi:hypothetical protein N7512_008480 [Penicillium capsulatum]|nr:hypothetical protein N7512_008480 [Penicillium capsulatum]